MDLLYILNTRVKVFMYVCAWSLLQVFLVGLWNFFLCLYHRDIICIPYQPYYLYYLTNWGHLLQKWYRKLLFPKWMLNNFVLLWVKDTFYATFYRSLWNWTEFMILVYCLMLSNNEYDNILFLSFLFLCKSVPSYIIFDIID